MPNPIKSRSDLILWLVLVLLWGASFVYQHTPLDGELLCVWRRITALNCPGCGLTRSFCAMSQLQWVQAFSVHPIGPFLYIAMVWLIVAGAIRHLRSSPDWMRLPAKVVRGYWIIVGVVFVGHFVSTVSSWLGP